MQLKFLHFLNCFKKINEYVSAAFLEFEQIMYTKFIIKISKINV